MKIHVLSDLHLEFSGFEPAGHDADVVVIAGDLHKKERGLEWIAEHFPGKPVIYVAGNHEFYGAALPRLTAKLQKKTRGTNVHFLERAAVDISGIRFLGATLWTDYRLLGPAHTGMAAAEEVMNDFKRIRVSPQYRRLRAFDLQKLHFATLRFLDQELRDPRPTIVVTHHAPSAKSVVEADRSDLLSSAYASDLDAKIEAWAPLVWIHGHTHHAVAYQIGATRVLSNPRGYPDEPVEGFVEDLCIEI